MVNVDQERVVRVVEHLATCYDGPTQHFEDCECLCHEDPPTQAELKSARSKAQARAKTRLSHEFKPRYRELYYLELAREGLTVVSPHRLGLATRRVLERERVHLDA